MADETTGATDDGENLEAMPPLDEIEVPGSEDEMADAMRELRTGQVITGTVVDVDPRDGVLVDVGMKSEGLIRPGELSRDPMAQIEEVLKEGDVIQV